MRPQSQKRYQQMAHELGEEHYDMGLSTFVALLDSLFVGDMGSTNVGDVSWVVQKVQAHVATSPIGTPLHTYQLTVQGKEQFARKGMFHAVRIRVAMARAAILNDL